MGWFTEFLFAVGIISLNGLVFRVDGFEFVGEIPRDGAGDNTTFVQPFVVCPDANACLVVYTEEDGPDVDPRGVFVRRTLNKGVTWEAPVEVEPLTDIPRFNNPQMSCVGQLCAVTYRGDNIGLAKFSTNGGQTWQSSLIPGGNFDDISPPTIKCFTENDQARCIMAAFSFAINKFQVLKSSDGGANFVVANEFDRPEVGISDIELDCLDDEFCIVALGGNSGVFVSKTNKGVPIGFSWSTPKVIGDSVRTKQFLDQGRNNIFSPNPKLSIVDANRVVIGSTTSVSGEDRWTESSFSDDGGETFANFQTVFVNEQDDADNVHIKCSKALGRCIFTWENDGNSFVPMFAYSDDLGVKWSKEQVYGGLVEKPFFADNNVDMYDRPRIDFVGASAIAVFQGTNYAVDRFPNTHTMLVSTIEDVAALQLNDDDNDLLGLGTLLTIGVTAVVAGVILFMGIKVYRSQQKSKIHYDQPIVPPGGKIRKISPPASNPTLQQQRQLQQATFPEPYMPAPPPRPSRFTTMSIMSAPKRVVSSIVFNIIRISGNTNHPSSNQNDRAMYPSDGKSHSDYSSSTGSSSAYSDPYNRQKTYAYSVQRGAIPSSIPDV